MNLQIRKKQLRKKIHMINFNMTMKYIIKLVKTLINYLK